MSILLVAGLGNPGPEYAATRHNAGFRVVDALASKLGATWSRAPHFDADIAWVTRPQGVRLCLLKPQTYMNGSGSALQRAAAYHKIPISSVAVVYDELNLPLGRLKLSVSGSDGGHNGLASILQHFGDGFLRFRVGIGPRQPRTQELKDFVLSRFSPEEQAVFDQTLPALVEALDWTLQQEPSAAMNRLNQNTFLNETEPRPL